LQRGEYFLRSVKVWLALAGGILAVAVVAGAFWRGLHPAALEIKIALAEERLFEDKVLAAGRVENTRRAEVVAPFAARLLSLKVKEGDRVEAGQVLAELDTGDFDDKVREAEAALRVAEAELARALSPGTTEEIAQAEMALAAARAASEAALKKFERCRQLFEEGAVSQAELEAAEVEHERARAETAAAEARLTSLKKADPETIAFYQARIEQARVVLKGARRTAAKGRLDAPISGVVQEVNAKEGAYLQQGAQILIIGDQELLQVVAELSEQDAGGVTAGQEAEINWSGSPGKTRRGIISYVAPAVTKKVDQTDHIVRAYVAPSEEGLLPGATVDVTIHRVKPHRAVLVPNEAVFEANGEKVVFTLEKGLARKQTVTVGGSNELFTEVVGGLMSGAKVILNPKGIKEGQPVRPSGGAGK
jgi:HlyD family secretion protein